MVHRLHDLGIGLNTQSILGSTALHTAAYFGQVNVLRSLLQRSPDLSLIDGFGRTALDWASDHELLPRTITGYLPPERPQDGPTARNHLRETVHRLLRSLTSSTESFSNLGYYLLHLDEEADAVTAFEQVIIREKETRHMVSCENCNFGIAGTRYVCKSCACLSLCGQCI